MLKIFWIGNFGKFRVGFAFVKPYPISCIDFAVPNTWNAIFCNLVALNSRTAENVGRNLPESNRRISENILNNPN